MPDGSRLGLYSGIVLAGIGMGMVVGQGVAVASPGDSTGAAASASPSSSDAADKPAADKPDTDTDAETDTDADTEADADADAAEEVADDDESQEADEAADERTSRKPSSRIAEDQSEDTASEDTVVEDAASEDAASEDTASEDAVAVASTVAEPATAAITQTAAISQTAAIPKTEGARTVRSIVSARPVTAEAIVTDVLTWIGLRPSVDDSPAPQTPVSTLVEGLWLAVRQNQYTWNNQRPVADVSIDGPGPDGAVTGSLNAVDFDDTALTYRLTAGPVYGRVRIDADGQFTYTPGAAAAGRADTFTIRVDDTSGNPFRVHGLLGLLGITRPTEVTIAIPANPSAPQSVSPITVASDSGSPGRVIDGRVTDHIVVNTADAAAVLNALSSALGAPAGFADEAMVIRSTAGTGDSAEHFYRFAETVGGVPVVGSEVILVTNADGDVTSVFNYYRGLGDGFDITPDTSVDDDDELRWIAGTAYVGSGADPAAIESFIAASRFSKELLVYSSTDDASPRLAWRVVVHVPDTGEMAPSGMTYLIDADGEQAGEVIIAVSNAQAAAATTTAKDWLGATRAITVETRRIWFFTTNEMADSSRMIATYTTSYGFFGLGAPVLPGKVVKKGWFSWDKAAVSAHANHAVAYDYFYDVLGRRSYDNAGAPIIVSIKYRPDSYPLGYANAMWDPTIRQFAYGDKGYFQAALDIVAHEYAHAVVTSMVGNGDPVWESGESGALNEAYADVFGLLIEGKSGADRWLIAEDSDNGTIRDLANPRSITTSYGPHRDRYSTRYTGKGDDGGEHVNSTIFSHAAYLMMTDPATADVSDDTWAKVFYHSLERLGATAMFSDGRAALLDAALSQGLTYAQRLAIAEAFDTVEIYGAAPSQTIAV